MLYRSVQVFFGALAGGIIGFFTELLSLATIWNAASDEGKLPVLGFLIGAGVGGMLVFVAGNRKFSDRRRVVVASGLLGMILGVLAAYFIFAPIATAFDPSADEIFRTRVQAQYQRQGVFSGAALGGVCGFIAVLLWLYLVKTYSSRT